MKRAFQSCGAVEVWSQVMTPEGLKAVAFWTTREGEAYMATGDTSETAYRAALQLENERLEAEQPPSPWENDCCD